jgi:uncharacterized CHY-type Zn-finger protein
MAIKFNFGKKKEEKPEVVTQEVTAQHNTTPILETPHESTGAELEEDITTQQIEKKRVKCGKCKHIWKTKSKMIWVTCPKCQYKTKA